MDIPASFISVGAEDSASSGAPLSSSITSSLVGQHAGNGDNDSEDSVFAYPGGEATAAEPEEESTNVSSPDSVDSDSDDDVFVYPGLTGDDLREPQITLSPAAPVVESRALPSSNIPSPAQLEAVFAAASSGDLYLLKNLVRNAFQVGEVESFALCNDAAPRTGLTALHAAASRGHLDMVKYLMEECGAMADVEDKEGETALHKAALNGHLNVVSYLLRDHADVNTVDADGWTALHNASSKGYLDIVRWLCEQGGAAEEHDGVAGVNVRSKGGWTPLMNAASKGHLPIVLYLLTKQSADPLIRNNWGETAYDIAAAVFEIWICDVLQKFEAERWRGTTVAYDPLAVHTTVPLIMYEYQRLDTRLKTLAVSGGRAKFSASGLGRNGRRPPFELILPKPDPITHKRETAAWRSDVQLPFRDDPWSLPNPTAKDQLREGAERSHFWLSDWTLDVTQPRVDVAEGWQYAHSFKDPADQWTADKPPTLQRLLAGSGAMAAGLGASGSRTSEASASAPTYSLTWVRRRRWVRVMRRRLDIPSLPFLQPDGGMYNLSEEGTLVPASLDQGSGEESEVLLLVGRSNASSVSDYVARARYLTGSLTEQAAQPSEELTAADAWRVVTKLERATTELRQGMLNDTDLERKTQAEVLLNAYSRELDRRKLAAGTLGLRIPSDLTNIVEEEDDSDDESFHYPGASPSTTRAPSIMSRTTDHVSRPSSSRTNTALPFSLSQAPDFRVPTHEAPQKVSTPRWAPPTPHSMHAQWERDDAVTECRACGRRFGFLNRRHCRRCGRIFCDRCSSRRVLLDPSDTVQDPTFPEYTSPNVPKRVCESCFDETHATVPPRLQGNRTVSLERIIVDQGRLSVPHTRDTTSTISDLADCPVCYQSLSELGDVLAQEAHVKNCLEGGTGTSPKAAKYLVYKLPGESPLIGVECVICLEEFVQGAMVARLSCLCSFHNTCLTAWLQRGRSCPVHARDT